MQSSVSIAPRSRLMAAIAAFTLFAMLAGIVPRPVRADSASTTAVLLGAAAAAAAILISNNVRHKAAQANTPVGRTQDGGTVYGNGRVVYPNGDVLYTGANGQQCRYDGYGVPCNNHPVAYYPRGYHGGDHDGDRDDRHKQHHYKHHHHHHHRGGNDDRGDRDK